MFGESLYSRVRRDQESRRQRLEALLRKVQGRTLSDHFRGVDGYVRDVLPPFGSVPNVPERQVSMLAPRSIARLVPGNYVLDEHRLEALGRARVVDTSTGVPMLLVEPLMIDPKGYVISGVHEGVVAVMRRAGLETVVVRGAHEIGERSDRDRILDAIEEKERYVDAACAHGITSIADLAARYAVPR